MTTLIIITLSVFIIVLIMKIEKLQTKNEDLIRRNKYLFKELNKTNNTKLVYSNKRADTIEEYFNNL